MPQTTTWSSCTRIVASHTHATAQSAIAPPYGPGPGTHRCYSEGSAADVSKHREHCRGSTDTIRHQLEWLSAITSNPLKLEGYLQFVYGQPVQLKMLNESESVVRMLLNFYWNSVPGRGDFATMWSCFACTLHGLRPANVLWAPSEEALHAPGLTPGSPLSFPGFFVHPSRAAFDHIRGGVPDGQWVEVMRVARRETHQKMPNSMNTREQIWFWYAGGSGVWYNVVSLLLELRIR